MSRRKNIPQYIAIPLCDEAAREKLRLFAALTGLDTQVTHKRFNVLSWDDVNRNAIARRLAEEKQVTFIATPSELEICRRGFNNSERQLQKNTKGTITNWTTVSAVVIGNTKHASEEAVTGSPPVRQYVTTIAVETDKIPEKHTAEAKTGKSLSLIVRGTKIPILPSDKKVTLKASAQKALGRPGVLKQNKQKATGKVLSGTASNRTPATSELPKYCKKSTKNENAKKTPAAKSKESKQPEKATAEVLTAKAPHGKKLATCKITDGQTSKKSERGKTPPTKSRETGQLKKAGDKN